MMADISLLLWGVLLFQACSIWQPHLVQAPLNEYGCRTELSAASFSQSPITVKMAPDISPIDAIYTSRYLCEETPEPFINDIRLGNWKVRYNEVVALMGRVVKECARLLDEVYLEGKSRVFSFAEYAAWDSSIDWDKEVCDQCGKLSHDSWL